MKHVGTKEIETERLILRRFRVDDAEAVYRNYASNSEVTKFLPWPTHESVNETRRILAEWVEGYASENEYAWAIELKALGEPIGSISVVSRSECGTVAELGCYLGRTWWNRGYATEALTAVLGFFFEVGFERIEARHDPENPRSGEVMKKCGMRFDGISPLASRNNHGSYHARVYSISSDNFRKDNL